MVKTARMNESIATKNIRNGRDKFQVLKPMASGGRFINGVGLLEIKITVGVSPVRVHAVDHRNREPKDLETLSRLGQKL